MKKLLIILSLLLSISTGAQDYAGTWLGVFHSDMASYRRSFHFSIQLKQRGRAVWGVYISGDSLTLNKAECACKVNGQVARKNKDLVNLYKVGIVRSTIPDEVCDFVNYLEARFLQKSGINHLSGNWYGKGAAPLRADGASGSFSVQRVSDTVSIDVDSYFSKLDKLIEKYNPGDTSFSSTPMQRVAKPATLVSPELPPRKIPVDKRENILLKELDIDVSIVDIELYDNGTVDDDTVSVYLNKTVVLKNYRLTEVAKKFQLKLDATLDNEILIAAENLGSIPPNTGLMIINANGVRHEIRITSSFEANAKVILRSKH